ncbi:MAG: hypothetical protein Q9224_002322, partial [Gallowayella concinna]
MDVAMVHDTSAWTAKDHAAFRGHWTQMKIEAETEASIGDASGLEPEPLASHSNLTEQDTSQGIPVEPWWPLPVSKIVDRSKGYILVNLGSSNTRCHKTAVDLITSPTFTHDDSQEETGFTLEVAIVGGSGSVQLLHLPISEDLINQPIIFSSNNPREAKVIFRIFGVQDDQGHRGNHIGTSIAFLRTLQERLAPQHETLVRDHTVPILAKGTLAMIGSITFSFLIVTPLAAPIVSPLATCGFWNHHGRTTIVGHRGSGANTTKHTNLQIGENTIQSFRSAVASGASCVEFDVQLTKDLVPVIFHDFLVMETGGNIPMHTLTYDQYMHLSKLQSPNGGSTERAKGGLKPRSHSEPLYDEDAVSEIRRRMQYTEEGIRSEIKGNLRGFSIHEPSTTLEELLTQLPETVAFNLEMKYPMLWEAEDRNMDFFAIELNLFVDTILKMIYRLGRKRSITFSSFSPEICILLSMKQQDYPILFISKAGSVPTGDVRAGSLQQAIGFAKVWGLAGIVMLSDVFVHCPRLLRYTKSLGL